MCGNYSREELTKGGNYMRKYGTRKIKKWYFVSNIVLTYYEKKIVLVIDKKCEITRIIYSN